MVATKMLVGGKRKHKSHHRKPRRKTMRKAATKRVSTAKRFVKPGSKQIARDKMHKCSKVIKTGKHKGKCRVVLSKAGQKARAKQLSKRKTHKKRK